MRFSDLQKNSPRYFLLARCAPLLRHSHFRPCFFRVLCLSDREPSSSPNVCTESDTPDTQNDFRCTGVSGPAALKLSAFGARVLNEGGYRGKLVVNWLAGNNPSRASTSRGGPHLAVCAAFLHWNTKALGLWCGVCFCVCMCDIYATCHSVSFLN